MGYNIVWTEEKRERAIDKLTAYFKNHGPGECIMQSDDSLIEAPELLSFIADNILKEGEGIVWSDHD